MTSWLYLCAEGAAQPSEQWPCCLVSGAGEQKHMHLDQVSAHLAGQPVSLVLPMEMCSWLRTEKWPSRRHPGAQAIGYAIEEQLSEDLEALHLSIGQRSRDGRFDVWVINRERFKHVLQLLTQLHIPLHAVHVDADCLPQDQPYAVWWLGRWLLGGALDHRLALQPSLLALMKPRLPQTLCWREDGVAIPHELTKNARPVNLMQGEFMRPQWAFPWKAASVSLLLLCALSWGATHARSVFLEDRAMQLRAESEQRFRKLYPQQARIVDLPAQLKALQKRNQGNATNSQMARLLKLTEQVIGASNIEVHHIEYRIADGWKLQLTADSFAQLEQLRERGQRAGLPIRLGNANKVQNQIQTLLTLEQAP